MKVSAAQPFQIIYSLYQHEYLGYVFESFIVHLDEKGKLTYQHQSISSKNAREFTKGLDARDFDLIELMDSMGQDAVLKHFSKKIMAHEEFFSKVHHKQKRDEMLQDQIEAYMEKRRAAILEKMKGKMLFEMGNDGEPTWRKVEVQEERANIQFHFMRGHDSTNYYPTITHKGKRVEIPDPAAYLICRHPAWMVLNGKLYGFEKFVDGKKLQPFLTKKHVVIPKNLEETYYNRFVAPLIASFDDIEASGFEIAKHEYDPHPMLTIAELPPASSKEVISLFDQGEEHEKPANDEAGKIVFDLSFKYGKHRFRGDAFGAVSVTVEKKENDYVFHRIKRNTESEKKYAQTLIKLGLPLRGFRAAVDKAHAFSWLNENRVNLLNLGFEVSQPDNKDKKYFVGKAVIELEVKENIDWFDIHAKIRFGEFEISFKELRKLILRKKVEFKLPNGEIAIIPDAWLIKYGDLFALSATHGTNEKPVLKKHHISLLQELEEGKLTKFHMNERLRNLHSFTGIRDYELPQGFQGTLRPYQKAGYNWLRFLNEFHLGGCLADDMGL